MVPQTRLSHLRSQAIPHSAQQHTTFNRKAATLQPVGPSSLVNEHNKPSLASSIAHASSHLISSHLLSSPQSVSPRTIPVEISLASPRLASPPLFQRLTRCTSHPIPSHASHPLTLPRIRIRKHCPPGRVLHFMKGLGGWEAWGKERILINWLIYFHRLMCLCLPFCAKRLVC